MKVLRASISLLWEVVKMSRLLNAEFHRLIKYKPYWIECIAVVLYGIYATLLNDFGYTPSIDSFLFEALPYICIITGVVFSQFIGEDYTCGTIRNKLINGHTRKTYYLTEIIVIFLANVTVFKLLHPLNINFMLFNLEVSICFK